MVMTRSLAVILLGLLCPAIPADDWPQYLGPKRDGVWRESGVSLDTPPRLLWKTPLGGGYCGPAVAKGRVYVADRRGKPVGSVQLPKGQNPNFVRESLPGDERIVCLDERTGKIVWEHKYDAPYSSVVLYAIGPRCTPLIHEGIVYSLGAEGHLLALSADEGKVLWRKNFVTDYGLEMQEWGTAAHPIVHKELLICTVGGKGSTVVAFDRKTGEEKWRALSAPRPGYGTPVIEEINGLRQLIVWDSDRISGLDPDSGKRHWYATFRPSFAMSIGAARVHENLVWVMGFNGRSAAIRVTENNQSTKFAWVPSPKKGVAGVMNTAYLRDGHVYSGGRRGQFRCVDIRTGERLWESTKPLLKANGSGRGAWQSAFTVHHEPSGQTLIFNDHGEMITASLSPNGYEEIARTYIIEPTHRVSGRMLVWSHPALANKRVYCRNDKEIRCYDLSKK